MIGVVKRIAKNLKFLLYIFPRSSSDYFISNIIYIKLVD